MLKYSFFLFFWVIQNIAFSTNYYVSVKGDDNNPGNATKPFRTIAKSVDLLLPGDSVFVLAGTYNETFSMTKSGIDGKPIVFIGEFDKTIIDAKNLKHLYNGLVEIEGVNWIVFKYFTLKNSTNQGIYIDNASNIIIKNNTTYNTYSSGIGAWGAKNIIIDSNKVELACNGGGQECISAADCDNFIISNNIVFNGIDGTIGGEGIDAKDGSRNGEIRNNIVHNLARLGIYVDSWDKHTYNIKVHGNIVYNCTEGIVLASEMGGLLEDIWIYNNLVYKNKFIGINVSSNGDDPNVRTKPIKNCYLINNTIYSNGVEWGGGIAIGNPDANNIIVRNNICSENLSFQITYEGRNSDGLIFDHNLINGFREYPNETRGTDYVEADPLFIDATNNNYNLSRNSPAIDKGSSILAPNIDILGNKRPNGLAIDIGAYEFYPSSGFPTSLNEIDFITVKPNPCSDYFEVIFNSYGLIDNELATLSLINLSGQKILSKMINKLEIQSHSLKVDVKELQSGIYIYYFNTSKFRKCGKLIINK